MKVPPSGLGQSVQGVPVPLARVELRHHQEELISLLEPELLAESTDSGHRDGISRPASQIKTCLEEVLSRLGLPAEPNYADVLVLFGLAAAFALATALATVALFGGDDARRQALLRTQ